MRHDLAFMFDIRKVFSSAAFPSLSKLKAMSNTLWAKIVYKQLNRDEQKIPDHGVDLPH
jgi:hypothetical protein